VQRVKETVEIIRTLLREGTVSYRGETLSIERFDLWFRPIRPELPIYLSAVFPQMLEVCGELAQGTLMAWSTLEAGRTATEHIALGARRVGRQPGDIDIASCLFEESGSFAKVISVAKCCFMRGKRRSCAATSSWEHDFQAVD
jgi:5,10-methylenetetrahydromethanopterin reductase